MFRVSKNVAAVSCQSVALPAEAGRIRSLRKAADVGARPRRKLEATWKQITYRIMRGLGFRSLGFRVLRNQYWRIK